MRFGSGKAIAMTDEEFRLIRDLICEHCGIYFPESMRFLVERRLQPRLLAHNAMSFRDYYRAVKYGPNADEFDEIVERVTTNETYFFRELYQLETLMDEILPGLHDSRETDAHMRIWSAGCSTGEEPYSIAMLLNQSSLGKKRIFDLFGNDISRKVLRTARAGIYTQSSFRDAHPSFIKRYFKKEGRTFHLCEAIRQKVTFGHLNLMDQTALALINNVDVILCRNVMIYFNAESRSRLLKTFYQKLCPGGFLLLGHAESLIHENTDFELATFSRDMVYRKPA